MLQEGFSALADEDLGHGRALVVEPHGPSVVGIVAPIPSPEVDRPANEAGVLIIVSVARSYFTTSGVPGDGKRFVDRSNGESYRILNVEDVMPRPFIAFTCRSGRVTEDAP